MKLNLNGQKKFKKRFNTRRYGSKSIIRFEKRILKEAKRYMDVFKNVPYIFNLGHGLLPKTKPEKLDMLIKFIREHK